jgi:hypothetical protein
MREPAEAENAMSTVADNIRRGLWQAIAYVEGTADQSADRVYRPDR